MNKEMLLRDRQALEAAARGTVADPAILADAEAACRLIAPLWPLKDFVAVNPALGFASQTFEMAAARLLRDADARLYMPSEHYKAALRDGALQGRHISRAARLIGGENFEAPLSILDEFAKASARDGVAAMTLSDVARAATGEDWSAFIIDQISSWAAGHFDEGQSAWKAPWRDRAPYAAWRAHAVIDRTPEIMGLKGFRARIATLPDDAGAALTEIAEALALPADARPAYFHRLLSTISGWAAYRRQQGWIRELRGAGPAGVIDMLAIRAAFDYGVAKCLPAVDVTEIWRRRLSVAVAAPLRWDEPSACAQTALELRYQHRIVSNIALNKTDVDATRSAALAVFCIDVRSERMRRALEDADRGVHTAGFAGFFGFPLGLVRQDDAAIQHQCPVLLEPRVSVCERAPSGNDKIITRQGVLASALKRFRSGAISSFAFVESLGAAFAGALIRDSMRQPAKEARPLGEIVIADACADDSRSAVGADELAAIARGAIAGMSLEGRFARLIALVGHGSTTTNNPYAAGLDCGACGGHTGEANARVAAAVLNDPMIRERLASLGVAIPADTHFVAALHDTTTDEVMIFDRDRVPQSHRADLERLTAAMQAAAYAVRRERAPLLSLNADDAADRKIRAKSKDWSEVRPEWGLAGCAAFIAAPRSRTTGVNLEGRVFLHCYDWRRDPDNSILELIMTAPLVVASWINLQYYGSTVDNAAFGSGDKTLHNVVGGIGVIEGCGGDLRVGLPIQSLHDGSRLVHEPLRLTAFIEAPLDRIEAVLAKHQSVRDLVANGWIHLIAMVDEGKGFRRRERAGTWSDVFAELEPGP